MDERIAALEAEVAALKALLRRLLTDNPFHGHRYGDGEPEEWEVSAYLAMLGGEDE